MNLSEFEISVDNDNKIIVYTKDDVSITQNLAFQSYELYKAGVLIAQHHDIEVIENTYLKLGQSVYPKLAKFENELFILLSNKVAIAADDGLYLGYKVKNTYEDFVIFESKVSSDIVETEINRVKKALLEKQKIVQQEAKTINERLEYLEQWNG